MTVEFDTTIEFSIVAETDEVALIPPTLLASLSVTVELITVNRHVFHGVRYGLDSWRGNRWCWECFGTLVPVKNLDLWQHLEGVALQHQIRWHWVKGHSGHEGNEQADRLANLAIDELTASSSSQTTDNP